MRPLTFFLFIFLARPGYGTDLKFRNCVAEDHRAWIGAADLGLSLALENLFRNHAEESYDVFLHAGNSAATLHKYSGGKYPGFEYMFRRYVHSASMSFGFSRHEQTYLTYHFGHETLDWIVSENQPALRKRIEEEVKWEETSSQFEGQAEKKAGGEDIGLSIHCVQNPKAPRPDTYCVFHFKLSAEDSAKLMACIGG